MTRKSNMHYPMSKHSCPRCSDPVIITTTIITTTTSSSSPPSPLSSSPSSSPLPISPTTTSSSVFPLWPSLLPSSSLLVLLLMIRLGCRSKLKTSQVYFQMTMWRDFRQETLKCHSPEGHLHLFYKETVDIKDFLWCFRSASSRSILRLSQMSHAVLKLLLVRFGLHKRQLKFMVHFSSLNLTSLLSAPYSIALSPVSFSSSKFHLNVKVTSV